MGTVASRISSFLPAFHKTTVPTALTMHNAENHESSSTDKYQHPGTTITAIKLPADGSPPTLVNLTTIDTTSDDGQANHEPDLTSAWGAAGFSQRNARKLELKGQRDASFNGVWYFLRCKDGSKLAPNEHHGGAFGDVFIVRMDAVEQGDGAGESGRAFYRDVPENWGECEGLARALVLSMPL